MCIHDDITDCDDCCYEMGFEDGKHQNPYDPEYKNWSQVNNYRDGYRTGIPKTVYWCCTASFDEHDVWCVNYKEKQNGISQNR